MTFLQGMSEPLMTCDQFETMRLYLVVLTVLYRLAIMPRYLQAYLNLAYDKVLSCVSLNTSLLPHPL